MNGLIIKQLTILHLSQQLLHIQETKCERDVGYIVDAIVYDLCHGGNVKSREAALRYVNQPVTVLYFRTRRRNCCKFKLCTVIMGNVLAQTDPSKLSKLLTATIPTAIVTQYNPTALAAESGALTEVTALLKIITDAIQQE